MMGIIIVIIIIVFLAFWAISCQHRLAAMNENVNNAMAQIGVQLSSRFDALTALLDLTKAYAAARAFDKGPTDTVDSFHLKLTTTDPYWEEIDLKIEFADSQLYGATGFGGFGKDMRQVCQFIKDIIRKDPLHYVS